MQSLVVRDRMSTPVVTERPDVSVTALSAMLRLRGISAVPIVKGHELLGIVSTTDLLRAAPTARAADIMTTSVVSVSIEDTLDVAARAMANARVHRVVAMEGSRVAGILSARDVLVELKSRKIMAPIATVMTMPVESIDIGERIDEGILRLGNANVHGLVVVDGMAPVGVFTHTEALAARRLEPSLLAAPIEEVMSYETVCLDVATPIFRAAAYAVSMNVRRILVVEHRRLVGIVSCLDLAGVLARAGSPPVAA